VANHPERPPVVCQALSIWFAAMPILTGPPQMALCRVPASVQLTEKCAPSSYTNEPSAKPSFCIQVMTGTR
jgi:hypothetical protein